MFSLVISFMLLDILVFVNDIEDISEFNSIYFL